ncbi:hypothetical protein EDB80DRAFT_885020 [Ilyonectria destructans]|nr:hypothetical protein EDB80DRAFT_885020 [Ilyonectria destructans]
MNSSHPHVVANVTGWTSDGHASDARASTSSADETHGGNIPQHELAHEPHNPKRRRACGACRTSKLRCEPDPNITAGPCKRCRKSGQDCTSAAPLKARQKKIRNRVEAIELKIVALRDTLRTQGSNNAMLAVEKSCSASGSEDLDTARSETAAACERQTTARVCRDSRALGKSIKYPELVLPPIQPRNNVADIIDRGILPMETAAELLARYNNKMIQHLPAVILPSTVSAAELRKTKPLLFLAIMAASSAEIPNLQRQLVEELRRDLARKTIIQGEKSLEIVQAFQLAVIWYWLPQMFEDMDFYQLVHMGVTMAIDIGLGREPSVARPVAASPFGFRADSFRRTVPPDPTTIESRRAWLTCYLLATSTSMTLHRPNWLQWTPFTAECFNILKNSFDAAPTDKYLCHLVWTHHIAEDIVVPFPMDDAIMTPNISDTRSQYTLRAFEHLLEEYTHAIRKEVRQPTLGVSLYVITLRMHEILLRAGMKEEMKPPFDLESLKDGILTQQSYLTTPQINSLSACLTAIEGTLTTFLAMELDNIRCLPVFAFARVGYAVVVLIRIYVSVVALSTNLGKAIDKDGLKVGYYLDSLLDKLHATAGDNKSRPAAQFLAHFVQLRSWFLEQGTVEHPTE